MTTLGLLTLVVCTRNRAALLERTLPALLALDRGGLWELVVVNSACTARTDEVIARASRGAPVPVRRVHAPRRAPAARATQASREAARSCS